jgi:hypothetical protein
VEGKPETGLSVENGVSVSNFPRTPRTLFDRFLFPPRRDFGASVDPGFRSIAGSSGCLQARLRANTRVFAAITSGQEETNEKLIKRSFGAEI